VRGETLNPIAAAQGRHGNRDCRWRGEAHWPRLQGDGRGCNPAAPNQ
jgi:hypothetical protein